MAVHPALDVHSAPTDRFLTVVDGLAATALEERGSVTRLFFGGTEARDRARAALLAAAYVAVPVDVDDEDWARRSQEGLGPVVVGRLTIAPPWDAPPGALIVEPSMGFGTGHHATTRLCLRALQALEVDGRCVLDVGTGSGVLALAAARLGAAAAVGLDNDRDAIAAAAANLSFNRPEAARVEFRVADLAAAPLPHADIVVANLTGATLARHAGALLGAVRTGGALIASGVLDAECEEVAAALTGQGAAAGRIAWEEHEEGWAALVVKKG